MVPPGNSIQGNGSQGNGSQSSGSRSSGSRSSGSQSSGSRSSGSQSSGSPDSGYQESSVENDGSRRGDRQSEGNPVPESGSHETVDAAATADQRLYFFPDQAVTETQVRTLLDSGTDKERAWVISHLLRYAQWDDIWTYVDRATVRAILERLDLPPSLGTAWARMLKVEAPVA